MPIIWRYLIKQFLKTCLLSMIGFVAILLTMRLDEIAHFASLGAPIQTLLLFIFHQMFYILPISLPLSCLISAFLLLQNLSSSYELTALRSLGFSLPNLLSPFLLTASFLSLANFWMISELATNSHLQTNLLKSELRSVNPLFILHNKHLMRVKGFYFEALGPSHLGEFATDVILALPNKQQKRLNLFLAKHISTKEEAFSGNQVSLITSPKNYTKDEFDDLLIENIEETLNQPTDFSNALKKRAKISNDYLKMPMLMIQAAEQKQALKHAKSTKAKKEELKKLQAQFNRSLSEITKRLSVGFAVFSFTLIGFTFGISTEREKKQKGLCIVIFLTSLYLISFFIGKGIEDHLILANLFYLLPHFIMISLSVFSLKQIAKGKAAC